eukprot:6460864-Amphidinium_carterae.1
MVQKLATMILASLIQGLAVSVDLCVALFNKTMAKEGMDVPVPRGWVGRFLLDMGLSNKRGASTALHQHAKAQKLHLQHPLKLKIAWTQAKWGIPWC